MASYALFPKVFPKNKKIKEVVVMKKLRIAAWLLAIATLIPLSTASCGGDEDKDNPAETKDSASTTVDTQLSPRTSWTPVRMWRTA